MGRHLLHNIIATICYSDVFDYPLTKREVWEFLIDGKISYKKFDKALASLFGKKLEKVGNYICLKNRKKIVGLRIEREEISLIKQKKALQIARILSLLPTIACIGISGSIASGNAKKDDDIDLCIITFPDSLWLTRGIVTCFLFLGGLKRKRNVTNAPNKFCTNLFLDTTALRFEKKRQTLFLAHELVQFIPLMQRGNTYEKLLENNKWIATFLPNAKRQYVEKNLPAFPDIFFMLLLPFEKIAKAIQVLYMQSHRSAYVASNHRAEFYPPHFEEKIMGELKKRVQQYV